MNEIILVEPSIEYEKEILAYRDEFPVTEEGIHGTSSLASVKSVEQWLELINNCKYRETVPENLVPARQYLLLRISDQKIVGMLNYRLALNDYLSKYGGHIGYSVVPSERRKGYAEKMVALALEKAPAFGLKKVLITCNDQNIASARTIEKNQGVLENKVLDSDDEQLIRRYWISSNN